MESINTFLDAVKEKVPLSPRAATFAPEIAAHADSSRLSSYDRSETAGRGETLSFECSMAWPFHDRN
jgi:hypothetical protein